MKALIDTCVAVDFLQGREPFAEDAKSVFQSAAVEKFSGFITAKSASDIYYLAHRTTHSDAETRRIMRSLLSLVGMLDSTASDVLRALSSETADFEDAIMIETAVRSRMDCIVTRNQKDYRKSPLPVCTPGEFQKLLEK